MTQQITRRSPRRIRPVDRYPTDPPTATSTRRPVMARSMFDSDRLFRALKAGLVEGIGPMDHPADELLISTVIALGCPRFAADQMRYNPSLRLAFYGLWCAVQEAAKGDVECQELVDVARATWEEARQVGLVADRPDMSIGLWDR